MRRIGLLVGLWMALSLISDRASQRDALRSAPILRGFSLHEGGRIHLGQPLAQLERLLRRTAGVWHVRADLIRGADSIQVAFNQAGNVSQLRFEYAPDQGVHLRDVFAYRYGAPTQDRQILIWSDSATRLELTPRRADRPLTLVLANRTGPSRLSNSGLR